MEDNMYFCIYLSLPEAVPWTLPDHVWLHSFAGWESMKIIMSLFSLSVRIKPRLHVRNTTAAIAEQHRHQRGTRLGIRKSRKHASHTVLAAISAICRYGT
jgi:hypothetical protein